MPNAAEATGSEDIKKGDHVLKLQGKAVTTTAELQEMYDAIAVGDTIQLVLGRDGEEHALTLLKPAPRGRIIKRGE